MTHATASTRSRRRRPRHLLLASVLVVTGALGGCGAGTVNNAEWLKTTMHNDLATLDTAMTKASQTPAGQRAPSREACSALNDWAAEASTHPRPEDQELSAAWDDVLAAVEADGTDACPSGDVDAISKGAGRIGDALNAMEDRIAVL
ncbi:hypothetical protein [Kribbella sp. VKM Ac-2566]|uniref:hypothetical protein n=1 Tax=Kribbella sp. VKM Ac-2566 TaxID=2512218 RepID=UPI0010624EAF|nr:hypothetical protein [Kribbella sp. VKM Ac-2566]TDW91091.1 hypothetical protein EV647_4659 [Kribbella sp. VKM Ac-2566]